MTFGRRIKPTRLSSHTKLARPGAIRLVLGDGIGNSVLLFPIIAHRSPTEEQVHPPPLVVCSPPEAQGSLWSTQEGHMFEQTEFAVVMTLLALAGVALMADEKIETSCVQMLKWIRTRGRR